jgi:hypothetical protein
MNRKDAIRLLRYAGYHQDSKRFVSVYIENHISYTNAIKEYREGYQSRINGMKCNCQDCNK